MNDTFINYIDQLLDLAECNDTFYLTSRAFNEFAGEVMETLSKGKAMKPVIEQGARHTMVVQVYVEIITAARSAVMKWAGR